MRKGMDGLAMLAQQALEQDPFSGALFAFRGKRGGLVKLLWFDGQGMCLARQGINLDRSTLCDWWGAPAGGWPHCTN
jgi:transposase